MNTSWGAALALPGLLAFTASLAIWLFLVPAPAAVGLQARLQTPRPGPAPSPIGGNMQDKQLGESTGPLPRSVSSGRLQADSAYESDSDCATGAGAGREGGAVSFLSALAIPGVIEFSLCLFFAKAIQTSHVNRCNKWKQSFFWSNWLYQRHCSV